MVNQKYGAFREKIQNTKLALNEAAARSREAADVGCESIGGVVAAYDNTTTNKIHSRFGHSWPRTLKSSPPTYETMH